MDDATREALSALRAEMLQRERAAIRGSKAGSVDGSARLAAFRLGEILAAPSTGDRFLSAVAAECARARQLFPGANLNALALMEEAGEVARALLSETPERVWAECVQLASMAKRVAEEGDRSTDTYRAARGLDPVGETLGSEGR